MGNQIEAWLTIPPAGGRSSYGPMLINAFRNLGITVREILNPFYQEAKTKVGNSKLAIEVTNNVLAAKIKKEPPDLLLDISPLNENFYEVASNQSTRTVFWLLENGRSKAYDYWKNIKPLCDKFYGYQGEPFTPEQADYLPWGGSTLYRPEQIQLKQKLLIHGSFSEKRGKMVQFLVDQEGINYPLKVVGPNWSDFENFEDANENSNVNLEARWTKPAETAELMNGRIVLIPWQGNFHNAVLPRVWFTMAAGGCVITKSTEELERHFTSGNDCLLYSSRDEVLDQITQLMNNFERCEDIVENAQKTIFRSNTLTHRIKTILDDLELDYQQPDFEQTTANIVRA